MILRRFETPALAHYSYVVGCTQSGRAAVVDPRRDVDGYLRFLESRALELTHVTETHIHADYASGALELAERTGAELALSAHDRGERYRYRDRALADGEVIERNGFRRLAYVSGGMEAWRERGRTVA